MTDTSPRFVYSIWGCEGMCLYVGQTGSPAARIGQHAALKEWWPQVERVDIVPYHAAEVTVAESWTIASLWPLHNLQRPRPLGSQAPIPAGPRITWEMPAAASPEWRLTRASGPITAEQELYRWIPETYGPPNGMFVYLAEAVNEYRDSGLVANGRRAVARGFVDLGWRRCRRAAGIGFGDGPSPVSLPSSPPPMPATPGVLVGPSLDDVL